MIRIVRVVVRVGEEEVLPLALGQQRLPVTAAGDRVDQRAAAVITTRTSAPSPRRSRVSSAAL
mgnify:CR=1 FL=1